MVTIDASTTLKVKKAKPKPTTTTTSITTIKSRGGGKPGAKKKGGGGGGGAHRRGTAPIRLKPKAFAKPQALSTWKEGSTREEQKERVINLLRSVWGESTRINKSTPHASSTTQDRGHAAADLALLTKELGVELVLKEWNVLEELEKILYPDGLDCLMSVEPSNNSDVIRPSPSSVSLASMDTTGNDTANSPMNTTTGASVASGTDTKRGKRTPPNAREGSLLLVRALAETVGRPVEPYLVGNFLVAALDECASSSLAVREAAEDAATALVELAHPWAFLQLTSRILLTAMQSTEWRVKYAALERLGQCGVSTAPQQVHQRLPQLIPLVTAQIWDTKPQVTKAAGSCLLAICNTCQNPDVKSAIPAVVQAICKPADTNKAVQELMSTTFVVSVDAPTLAILCPVLARALKEKLAIHKRAACLVISNMSKLVENPQAVAPFGPLLVPELKKVATNVQFEEIRDAALSALNNLTRALGDSYQESFAADADSSNDNDHQDDDKKKQQERMEQENARVKAEQERIQQERDAAAEKEAALAKQEEEERQKFKEAMDAQRELDKITQQKAEKQRITEMKKKDQAMRSTKGAKGKCQACGFKKCKKTCVFYSGK